MILPASHPVSERPDPSCGGVLVDLEGRRLPLRGAALRADCCAGVAHVVLEQRFENPHDQPLHVTYRMPLPHDGAVGGYRFRIGAREIVGEVDRKARARERFEQALVDGHTAALLEEERTSLFTQEIGNVPPHAEIVVELRIDQKLAWVSSGGVQDGWEWRFPTVVAPRYLGAPGRVPDARDVTLRVTEDEIPARATLALAIRDALGDRTPDSPSHPIACERRGGGCEVRLAEGSAALDRDVVVRWSVPRKVAGAQIDVARPVASHAGASDAYGLLAIVPPEAAARPVAVDRDLVVLLDTSGSMDGEPLAQARRVVSALVDSLGDRDRLELVEFSTAVRRWKSSPVFATAKNKAEAQAWLGKLRASGGTEMRTGILAALSSLRAEAQRQVVLVSDGLIGFEAEVVGEIHRSLPAGCRVHTVGVGSAVNRSLTAPAARAGHGIEIVIGLGEDPERAAARLLARTCAPIVVDLELSGSALVDHAPVHLPDLFAGSPAVVATRLRAEGGELVVRGRTSHGAWEERVRVPVAVPGEGSPAVTTLWARERVEDLEMRRACGNDGSTSDLDREIESIGIGFSISTRLTSWVAIDSETSVDPRGPSRREEIPQQLPFGMSVQGLGLRSCAMPPPPAPGAGIIGAPMQTASITMAGGMMPPAAPMAPAARMAPPKAKTLFSAIGDAVDSLRRRVSAPVPEPLEELADEEAKTSSGMFARSETLAARELVGRFTILGDGRIAIEVTIDAALASGEVAVELVWQLPDELVLELADGTWITVALDASRTTRAGTLAAGTVLRVVLQPPASRPADPVALHLGGPMGPMTIRRHAA